MPDQEITTLMWSVGRHGNEAVFACETRNPEGDVVVKDGLAELAS